MTAPAQPQASPRLGPLTAWGRALAVELTAVWRQFPHRGFFWLLLLGWILMFEWFGNSTLGYIRTKSLFGWVIYNYEAGAEDAHGYFIPWLVLLLLWWKKQELLALPKAPWWPGLALLFVAICVHLFGFLVQQARISIVGFFGGVYAITGLVWGAAWLRTTFFPFCLLVFCVPVSSLTDALTFPLRQLATAITVAIAHAVLGIGVVQQGTAIYDPAGRFQYDIAAACSGLRSLTALLIVTMVYGFMFFRLFWQRGVIILLAAPAAVLSNVLRLLLIVIAAQLFGQAGGNYVHNSLALSFLPYVVGFGLVYLAGRLMEKLTTKPKEKVP